ncbi:MAG: hypothetical protein M3164_03290 [Actinomycetota bacterium]|nr:hypothetical protein [Actinomycetota bacterium]
MQCSELEQYLIAHHDVLMLDLPPEVREHLEACPRCRLEFEHNRKIAAELAGLADVELEPPIWLLGTVTETTIDHLRRRQAIRATGKQLARPRVLAGGALLIAGLAGALLVRGRVRRSRESPRPAIAA